jgi:cystine transport system substrate-binding protein
MVLSGRVDATLNAELSFYDYLKEHPDAPIKIVALTDDASEVAIPLRKEDATVTLREAIDEAIAELSEDGTLQELSEKYFGSDISKADIAEDSEAEAAEEGAEAAEEAAEVAEETETEE